MCFGAAPPRSLRTVLPLLDENNQPVATVAPSLNVSLLKIVRSTAELLLKFTDPGVGPILNDRPLRLCPTEAHSPADSQAKL